MPHQQADRERLLSAPDSRDESAPSRRRGNREQSIKRRVIRLVLIPGVVALALWLVASGYLVFQGFYNREVAKSVRSVSIPSVPALASVQQERRVSIAYLARPSGGMRAMLDQRQRTDAGLAAMRTAADAALGNAPNSIVAQWKVFTEYLDRLPSVRSAVDARSTDGDDVYDFYNDLLDAAVKLFDTQARIVPDVAGAQGGIVATEAFRVSDLMSRTGSTIDAAFASGRFSTRDHIEFVNLMGAYHASLDNIAPHLEPDPRKRYDSLVSSDPWKDLVEAENALTTAGAWRTGPPKNLALTQARWEALTRQISDQLVGLTVEQADRVSARTLRTGNNQLLAATLGSLLALCIAVAAIIWAVRQSQVLVDQALSVRLAQLGRDAAAVVDQQLPALMDRLRRHEKVDADVDLPTRDYGSDEIGQVADVIRRSLQVAAGAAIDEATTRAAGMAMLMGVARRPQRPLQHGLRVIEELQNRIGDEQTLTELFDIHHQLAQTRRFLENLIVLAGGQIGRRFQNPVPMRRVLLAAFGEAEQYQRIMLRNAPDAALLGQSVTGTVHLLAELLDNALAFSPPASTVSVTCHEVKNGIAVEIEDAGVGMTPETLERANTLLATAPTPDLSSLKEGLQVGLHVVAALAKRDGIRVTLRASAYGGLLAIVLLPQRIIVADPAADVASRPAAPEANSAVPVAGPRSDAATAVASAGAVATLSRPPVQARRRDTVEGAPRAGNPGGGGSGPQTNGNTGVPHPPEVPLGTETTAGRTPHARPALPLRQPQQHLAPMLRDGDATEEIPETTTSSTRLPEETRDRLARYQRGWAAGRAARTDRPATSDDQGRKA